MGFVANSLELGCDCLGHIKYFDGVVNNAQVGGWTQAAQPVGADCCHSALGSRWMLMVVVRGILIL